MAIPGRMIRNMLNSKKCVVAVGVKKLTIFLLILLKLKLMVSIVFSMKAKTYILNAFPKVKLPEFLNVAFN